MLLGGMFYKCQLGLASYLLIFCLIVLSIINRVVLKYLIIPVDSLFFLSVFFCFMHFEIVIEHINICVLFLCVNCESTCNAGETLVWTLSQEDTLEKEMATHSSILAWKIPLSEEPGRLQSMGSGSKSRTWLSD